MKQKQTRTRNTAALLAISGAVLAALSAHFPETSSLARVLVGVSGAFVAASTYLGRQIIKPATELRWTKARALAEALKRECWLFLLGAPPYDVATAAPILSERAFRLGTNSGLTPLGNFEATSSEPPPEVESIDGYIARRLGDQIGWYEGRARQFAGRVGFWKKVGYVLGGMATLLGGATSFGWQLPGEMSAWIPVTTTATAAIASFLHAGRFESLIASYRDTARQLRYRLASFRDLAEKNRDAELQLVIDCESIMSAENEAWRVEWKTAESSS